MPALQPPSRTATPTPIDALLAPLHLGASSASPHSPPHSPPSADGLRSRRSTAKLPSLDGIAGAGEGLLLFGSSHGNSFPTQTGTLTASPSSTSLFDSPDLVDITRPSLRRANHDAHALAHSPAASSSSSSSAAQGTTMETASVTTSVGGVWTSPRRGSPRNAADVRGKGKGRAVDVEEREVIVHKVLKTDSIASISVKYGITPQALRTSNRLWPSDPLFLRSELLIPLDQCHLPSLALRGTLAQKTGEGTEEREGGGEDLMRWGGSEAGDAPPPPSATSPRPGPSHFLATGSDRLLYNDDDGENAATPQASPRESSEFLTIWDDDNDAPQTGTKVLTPNLVSASSLGATPNPFAGMMNEAAVGTTGTHSLLREEIGPEPPPPSTTPPHPQPRPAPHSLASSTSIRLSSEAEAGSPRSPASSSSPPSGPPPPPPLQIKRLPASQLAFFPAPSVSPPLARTTSSSNSSSGPRLSNGSRARLDGDDNAEDGSSSLFFRPLAKQLQQLSFPLPSFLVSPSAPIASSPSAAAAAKGGRIRLPPSPNLVPSSSSSYFPSNPSRSHVRKISDPHISLPLYARTSNNPAPPGGGGGWSLLDFGAEEDEANQLVQLRQMQSHSQRATTRPNGAASSGGGGVGRSGSRTSLYGNAAEY
ncbi:hypothetical protein JCM10908_007149 [Rhodotorula pacifica]|uniref:LysM peptidoglycan-binding domain-containing protein n=1 Tax=Rhodotorula pacifica TaxID=1495444 RepID=UPI0031740D30